MNALNCCSIRSEERFCNYDQKYRHNKEYMKKDYGKYEEMLKFKVQRIKNNSVITYK